MLLRLHLTCIGIQKFRPQPLQVSCNNETGRVLSGVGRTFAGTVITDGTKQ